MARDDEVSFKPRLGRSRARNGSEHKHLSFTRQVMRAVTRHGGDPRRIGRAGVARTNRAGSNGRFNARGRGAKIVRTFPRESGWSVAERGMRFRARRVIVKARVVKMRGSGSRAAHAHLRYVQREGVSLDGERGKLYSRSENEADGSRFLDHCQDDRHQFRLIVAPEDGAELADLRAFTRGLMAEIERDLGTGLDWVAVDHHDTGRPHTHIVIRGVTDEGKVLNIAGDYIAHGIRHRASELVTLELGLQSDWEVQQQLGREVEQERFTRLDRAILEETNEEGFIDLRGGGTESYLGQANPHLLIQRLKKLERMGLALQEEPLRWSASPEMERTLRELGERGDIIKTMHRALSGRGIARGTGDYVIHRDWIEEAPVIGRVVDKGLAGDQLGDRLHLVIDGIDGRVHYLEVAAAAQAEEARIGSIVEIGRAKTELRPADRNILVFTDRDRIYRPSQHLAILRANHLVPDGNEAGYVEAHVRRLEALRRAGIVERLDADHWRIPGDYAERAQDYDARRTRQLAVRVLSIVDLETQITANAATWLDRNLIADSPILTRDRGFGHGMRDALTRRRQWLIAEGLAREEGDKTTYRRGLLATLARRELQQMGERLARERGLHFYTPAGGERISGTYRESIQLISGKYAVVERSREFTLVPWRPIIEKELGRTVSGFASGDGISWELGRSRGRGVGI